MDKRDFKVDAYSRTKYRVDNNWKHYARLSSSSSGTVLLKRDNEVVLAEDNKDINPFPHANNAKSVISDVPLIVEDADTLPTWYPSTGVISDVVSITINTDRLEMVENTPINLVVEAELDSSTSFSQEYSFTFDVAEILIDAVAIGAIRYTRSFYGIRAIAYFTGLLKSVAKGSYVVRAAFRVSHSTAVDDPYDEFNVNVRVSIGSAAVLATVTDADAGVMVTSNSIESIQKCCMCGCDGYCDAMRSLSSQSSVD